MKRRRQTRCDSPNHVSYETDRCCCAVASNRCGEHFPSFQEPQVAEFDQSGNMTLVPAQREPTVRDVLTHTSGIVVEPWYYSKTFGAPEALWKMHEEASKQGVKIFNDGISPTISLAEMMEIVGRLPLLAQMLLNGGELDGVRVLSEELTQAMTSHQVDDLRENWSGNGFGYHVAVQVEDSSNQSMGSYTGAKGMYFWVGDLSCTFLNVPPLFF